MAISFPPPSNITRAQYGNLTYDREFHAEKHNAEYKTNLTTETECPITYNTLEGRAVLYHDAGGEKHPSDAVDLVEWINQKATCPICSLNLDAKPFLKPFPWQIEARLKFIEYASRLTFISSAISAITELASGNTYLGTYAFLAVLPGFALESYETAKAIRERRTLAFSMNFELNDAALIATISAASAVLITAYEIANPVATTMAVASTGIGMLANAVKGYFGW